MPGAGGTGPVQQPNQLDDLREQLIQAITDQLHGGQPQAPQYQPAQVSPQQGFAMARNPQLAPMLNQNIQAPAQAQFQQQQAAFEAAMQGRQQAMQLGAGMLNTQTRAEHVGAGPGGRPALATIVDEDGSITGTKGKRITVNVSRGPDGRLSQIEEIGATPWAPQIVSGTSGGEEGNFLVSKDNSAPTKNLGIKPRPAAGTVEHITDVTSVLRNIDAIKSNPLVQVGQKGDFEKRLGQETVRALPLVGPQISSRINPDVEAFESDIDNVRSRVQLILTGKVVNQTEIKRLLGLIPAASTATNPEFFNGRMQKFQDEFTISLRRQARLRPDLFTPEELLSLGITASHSGGGQPSSDLQDWLNKRNVSVSP